MVVAGGALWWFLFGSWLLFITWFDGTRRRVPNLILVAALVVQLAFLIARSVRAEPLSWPGATGWASAGAGFVLGLAFVVFWFLRVMGAGDVKFLAVLGAWTGLGPLIPIVAGASILAMLHALAQIFYLLRSPPEGMSVANHRAAIRGTPYAAYLAVVALSVALMQWNSLSCSWFSLRCSTGF